MSASKGQPQESAEQEPQQAQEASAAPARPIGPPRRGPMGGGGPMGGMGMPAEKSMNFWPSADRKSVV